MTGDDVGEYEEGPPAEDVSGGAAKVTGKRGGQACKAWGANSSHNRHKATKHVAKQAWREGERVRG